MAFIFAYGSLMGDNALGGFRARPARLSEFHRAFNHQSTLRWGQPDEPCPILGLSPGGECWGVLFEVPPAREKDTLAKLERRESAGERRRMVQAVETREGRADAFVWVSRPAYVNGRADLEALSVRLRRAHGVVGTGVEYVRTLVHALEQHALRDELVESLWERVRP